MSEAARSPLERFARRALDGDRNAVHHLVRALQGDIYGLALRMLWNREDAEDATQEILVRIVTRLSQFAADLAEGLSAEGPADGERSMLTEEVKIGCTLGMLQCLDRPHRLAYVLGEILELPAAEAADAMDLEPATFRKRLQRARERIESFTREHCGLVSDSAACQCNRRVPAAVQLGRARADDLQFAETAASFEDARTMVRRVEQARRALELHRASRPKDSHADFARGVLSALEPAD